MEYIVKIAEFEGPFDLILYFIERDEIDIYDIPIAKITDDFLHYIKELKHLNIELASEFILVAATLMRVKAKTLLPRKELDDLGNEIDPRDELVQKLLEYKQFKAVIGDLQELETEQLQYFKKGDNKSEIQHISNEYATDMDLESLDLFKLLKTFNRVIDRFEDRNHKVEHKVTPYPYSLQQEKDHLLQSLKRKGKIDFVAIFDTCVDRIGAIFKFLAILELIQQRHIGITLGKGVNNFWITAEASNE